jgi:hypothetical protein
MLPMDPGWNGVTCGINNDGDILVQGWSETMAPGVFAYKVDDEDDNDDADDDDDADSDGTVTGPVVTKTDLSAWVTMVADPMADELHRPVGCINENGSIVGMRVAEDGTLSGVMLRPSDG